MFALLCALEIGVIDLDLIEKVFRLFSRFHWLNDPAVPLACDRDFAFACIELLRQAHCHRIARFEDFRDHVYTELGVSSLVVYPLWQQWFCLP